MCFCILFWFSCKLRFKIRPFSYCGLAIGSGGFAGKFGGWLGGGLGWLGWLGSAGGFWGWFGWFGSSAGRCGGWFGRFAWGLGWFGCGFLLGTWSGSTRGRSGNWSAGWEKSRSSGCPAAFTTTTFGSNGRVVFTGFCFVGFFLEISFTLDWYTYFDLGLPTLGAGTHGDCCTDLFLGLPTLDAGAGGLLPYDTLQTNFIS